MFPLSPGNRVTSGPTESKGGRKAKELGKNRNRAHTTSKGGNLGKKRRVRGQTLKKGALLAGWFNWAAPCKTSAGWDRSRLCERCRSIGALAQSHGGKGRRRQSRASLRSNIGGGDAGRKKSAASSGRGGPKQDLRLTRAPTCTASGNGTKENPPDTTTKSTCPPQVSEKKS